MPHSSAPGAVFDPIFLSTLFTCIYFFSFCLSDSIVTYYICMNNLYYTLFNHIAHPLTDETNDISLEIITTFMDTLTSTMSQTTMILMHKIN